MTFKEDVGRACRASEILTAAPGYLLRVSDHQDTVLRKQRRCLRLIHEPGGFHFFEFLRVKLFENPVGAKNLRPDVTGLPDEEIVFAHEDNDVGVGFWPILPEFAELHGLPVHQIGRN